MLIMEAVLTLSLILLITSHSTAQLFPFSNLRHYFEYQAKNGPGGSGVLQIPNANDEENTGRPYRHTESQNEPKILDLPSIPSFGPGDIFFEQPQGEDKLSIKREDNPEEDEVREHNQQKRRRKPTRTNYETRIEYSSQKPEYSEKTDTVLVTPKPVYRIHKPKHNSQVNADRSFTKTTKLTTSKPQVYETFSPIEESSRIARPVQYGSMQIKTSDEPVLLQLAPNQFPNSKREDRIESTSELTFPSEDPTFVESIPSLNFAVEQNQYRPNTGGLVDYLTPPKLPSVYSAEHNLNPQEFYGSSDDDVTSRLSNLKPPPPTPAKKVKYRIKKYRLKATRGPPHAVRIRKPKAESLPSTPQPKRHSDKITVENVGNDEDTHTGNSKGKSAREVALEQAGSQLNEQITAETGFTGVAAATHGSDQRVEFQMHGQSGPDSYKFGYDTGKGHNRQFRFEEKDNHGHVKGHYGYYDKSGKLQVVNYEADPEHGFKADPA